MTVREKVIEEMQRRGPCKPAELAKHVGLREGTVANVVYDLYVQGYARRPTRGVYELVRIPGSAVSAETDILQTTKPDGEATMPEKVIHLLRHASDQAMSFREIFDACGLTRQETGAVLSNLVKREIVARPRRGYYRLRYAVNATGLRAEAVLRFLDSHPWARISEIKCGADRNISTDTIRRILSKLCTEGTVKKEQFFYAMETETQSCQEIRQERRAHEGSKDRGALWQHPGRPPKTRRALLKALRAYNRPRTVETLARRVDGSENAVRTVLAKLIEEGIVRAIKMRRDSPDMRLVDHYEIVRPEAEGPSALGQTDRPDGSQDHQKRALH